jgi:chemosensory pili system protein ChpA (sensor histidine kinase/response regulator)
MSLSVPIISDQIIEQMHHELAALQQCVYKIQVSDIQLDIHNFNSIEDCLSNLKQLFNNVGQLGLYACCERLQMNISHHLMRAENLSAEECALILEWKILVNAYIANLNNERIADAIVGNLSKVSWNNPIDIQDKKKIKNLLLNLNNDSELVRDDDIDKQEFDLADEKSTESQQDIDLDLSAEKNFDHDSIDLNDAVTKNGNSPSSKILDDIEKELFTEDENIIIINEVSDNDSVVVTDDELFTPANDTQIKSAQKEENSSVDNINKISVVDESDEDFKEKVFNDQLNTDTFDDELFTSEELTEININTIELNTLEDKIISLGNDSENSSSHVHNNQSLNQDDASTQNNNSEKILQSIEDELFMPGKENDDSDLSMDDYNEDNFFHESVENAFEDEINTSFKEYTEADHHSEISEDQSDLMLDSLADELFTPDCTTVDSSDYKISLFSKVIQEDPCLAVNIDEDVASSGANNEQIINEVNDEIHELDDIVNSLFAEDQQSTADERNDILPGTEITSDIEEDICSRYATQNNDEAINLDYPDWSKEQKELLSLIVIEVKDALNQQEDIALTFLSTPIEENAIREFMSLYVEQVERMASAAEMVGLLALQKTCEVIHDYLLQYEKESIDKVIDSHKTILLWPQVVLEYLTDIYAEKNQVSVIEYLSDDAWCLPIGEQQINELQSLFLTSTINVEQSEEDKRKDVATEVDVSIIIPDDVQTELLDGLLQELPNQTEEFSHAVQALNGNDFLRHIEIAQRIAHTIKGAANTVGIQGLASITHNLEDILSALAKNKVKPTTNLQSALIDGSDCLEQMTEYLLGGGPEPQDSLHTLQVILDWANYIDEFGPPTETEDELNIEDRTQHPVKISISQSEVAKPAATTAEPAIQNAEAALRIPAAIIDNLLMQSGENIIAASQMHDQVKQLLHSLRDVKSNRDHVQEISQSLEHLIDIQGVGSRYLNRVNDQKFDPLELDQYNELHTYSRRLIEATNDSVELVKQLEDRLTVLHTLIADQVSAQKESQYNMLKTRMVQVDSIAARLKRGVRQAAKICNKSVQLEIIGGETLVDNKILVNLIDPLMHLLRNAVDHGLESDEERQTLNKPLPAIINLEVYQDGDRMIVVCHDDGRGLDVETIRNRAIEYKLIDRDQMLDDDQIKQLILKHGFSTRAEVTQLSGRGVGLDVVASQVKSMNGIVSVHSEHNKGTSFELSMPVSLLSAHALLLELSIGNIAVSTVGVEEIIHLEKNQLIKHSDEYTYHIDDKSYQIVYIEHLLGLPDDYANDKSSFYTGMKISGDTKIIVVPNISNTREIIIKPFSKFLPKIAGLIGTTILGNGEISSVIDIKDLLEYHSKTHLEQRQSVINVELKQPKLTALIVEDSLSTRKSLAEFMRDLHYQVYTAKDGLEAIDVMSACQPDIILSDLEMPRMNGLELTSHLRANQKTKDIPVIMITSRTTEKHIQEAKSIGVNEYLTKPFREDILFEKVNQLVPII